MRRLPKTATTKKLSNPQTEDLAMRNHLKPVFTLMLLAAFCLSGWTVLAQKQNKIRRQPRRAIAARRVPVWEYKIIRSISEEEINKLGAEGWELAATLAPDSDNMLLYFKRRKR
jgi:hypothetical protein